MKYVLLLCLIILFGLIGYGVALFFLERKRFFFELKKFLVKLKVDINFLSKRLPIILNESQNFNDKNIRIMLSNYKLYIMPNKSENLEDMFKQITILTYEEKESIFAFFKGLGMIDVYEQTKNLESFMGVVENYYDCANSEAKKFSSLFIKLGIIVGSFIALILL